VRKNIYLLILSFAAGYCAYPVIMVITHNLIWTMPSPAVLLLVAGALCGLVTLFLEIICPCDMREVSVLHVGTLLTVSCLLAATATWINH